MCNKRNSEEMKRMSSTTLSWARRVVRWRRVCATLRHWSAAYATSRNTHVWSSRPHCAGMVTDGAFRTRYLQIPSCTRPWLYPTLVGHHGEGGFLVEEASTSSIRVFWCWTACRASRTRSLWCSTWRTRTAKTKVATGTTCVRQKKQ